MPLVGPARGASDDTAMLATYSNASTPGTPELSPPSKSAPPLSETASATASGRPQDARGTMHSSSALLTKHAGTTPRSDSLSSSTNARPHTAATVPPLAAPARDESAESAGSARYRKRAPSPCAGDPVTAAVDAHLEWDCAEQTLRAAALGRLRRLDRVRRGRGRRHALEHAVHEPSRCLRQRRAEPAEQPRRLVGRGRAEPRAAHEHARSAARAAARGR